MVMPLRLPQQFALHLSVVFFSLVSHSTSVFLLRLIQNQNHMLVE